MLDVEKRKNKNAGIAREGTGNVCKKRRYAETPIQQVSNKTVRWYVGMGSNPMRCPSAPNSTFGQ